MHDERAPHGNRERGCVMLLHGSKERQATWKALFEVLACAGVPFPSASLGGKQASPSSHAGQVYLPGR